MIRHTESSVSEAAKMPTHAIRIKELCKTVALSRSSVYLLLRRDPSFPRGFRLSKRARAWLLSDVLAWLHARSPH